MGINDILSLRDTTGVRRDSADAGWLRSRGAGRARAEYAASSRVSTLASSTTTHDARNRRCQFVRVHLGGDSEDETSSEHGSLVHVHFGVHSEVETPSERGALDLAPEKGARRSRRPLSTCTTVSIPSSSWHDTRFTSKQNSWLVTRVVSAEAAKFAAGEAGSHAEEKHHVHGSSHSSIARNETCAPRQFLHARIGPQLGARGTRRTLRAQTQHQQQPQRAWRLTSQTERLPAICRIRVQQMALAWRLTRGSSTPVQCARLAAVPEASRAGTTGFVQSRWARRVAARRVASPLRSQGSFCHGSGVAGSAGILLSLQWRGCFAKARPLVAAGVAAEAQSWPRAGSGAGASD